MKHTLALLAAATLISASSIAFASEGTAPPKQDWPHHGVTGTYDKAAVQRGFQVYKEVCASCHSMQYLKYRNLQDLGYTESQVKALAAEYNVTDGPDDLGNMFERPARPSDAFVKPFANEKSARAANNGALPPDLSLVVKARKHGEDYIFGMLTGYEEPPEGVTVAEGMHYNKYFPGHQIAMAAPLTDGRVTYSDGTAASIDQSARDVTQFLAWASEPYADQRKQLGIKVMLYLLVFAGVLYGVKRRVWRDIH